MTYKPLPSCLTVSTSTVEGLGLFATKDIPAEKVLGISHVKDDRFENGYIRTPLGGFYNHSNDPNCTHQIDEEFIRLMSIKKINKGDELTVSYCLYKIKDEDLL